MNKFELNKTMECFGFNKQDVYEINGLKYYHDNRYFTIVKGKTPLELAKLIMKKYDNNIYKIRVNGLNENQEPAYDVFTYHIDTIEGLIAFIIETKNYYNKIENDESEIENITKEAYQKILESVNPELSTFDWMINNSNRKDYFKTILSESTDIDVKLRKTINEFDNTVNPFSNNNLSISNNNFIVNGDSSNTETWFILEDKESKLQMRTNRNVDGFTLKLIIPTTDGYDVTIYHYFDKDKEILAFETYNKEGITRLEYNLTTKTFGEHYGEKHPATRVDKSFVITNLISYINIASNVIAKNTINADKTTLTKCKNK